MAVKVSSEFTIPDVQDAVQIENAIEDLRKDIKLNCTKILKRAREIDATRSRSGAFRLRYWETTVSQIREAQMSTFSIKKLRQLKDKCNTLLQQIEQFSK